MVNRDLQQTIDFWDAWLDERTSAHVGEFMLYGGRSLEACKELMELRTRHTPTHEALSCDGCYYRNRIEDTAFPCNKCVRCGMGDYYGEEHMNYRTKSAKEGEG